jgi:hypothetical protein
MNQNNQIQTAYKKQLEKYQKCHESVNQSNFVENENRNQTILSYQRELKDLRDALSSLNIEKQNLEIKN